MIARPASLAATRPASIPSAFLGPARTAAAQFLFKYHSKRCAALEFRSQADGTNAAPLTGTVSGPAAAPDGYENSSKRTVPRGPPRGEMQSDRVNRGSLGNHRLGEFQSRLELQRGSDYRFTGRPRTRRGRIVEIADMNAMCTGPHRHALLVLANATHYDAYLPLSLLLSSFPSFLRPSFH